jgi:CubicO group peptidase (beta-lactamase class C family)
MFKWFFFLFLPLGLCAQPTDKDLQSMIRAVENSLAPNTIYGEAVPSWNLEERMRMYAIKGLSIAVVRNYKLVWAKGYGWADSAENRRVTPETRFQAASISKTINSLGVLKLVEQGKLDPLADVNRYLKGWQFPYDSLSRNKKINTYQLLSHSAGLGIHGFPGYKRTDALPTIYQVLDGQRPANTRAVRSIYEPGRSFEYSGGGTTITQLLVTSITGQEYAAFMQKEVLDPLGMSNSSYRIPISDTTTLASGYYSDGRRVDCKFHVYPEQAAASLWTTPSDLAKYIIECQLALEGKSAKVISSAMMKKRMTPYIDTVIALGLFLINRGVGYFGHNGGNEAFLCTHFGSLKGGDGVVVMINGENFNVINELVNSVARVYGWKDFYKPEFKKLVKLAPVDQDRYLGKFKLMSDTLTVLRCGNEICLYQTGQPGNGYQMLFADKDNFSIMEVPNAFFTAIRNEKDEVVSLTLKQGGKNIILSRINN